MQQGLHWREDADESSEERARLDEPSDPQPQLHHQRPHEQLDGWHVLIAGQAVPVHQLRQGFQDLELPAPARSCSACMLLKTLILLKTSDSGRYSRGGQFEKHWFSRCVEHLTN